MRPPGGLSALALNEVRLARVTNYVQLLHPVRPPQRASVNDIVEQETVVRTGKDSRAELTFSGETVVRLAAHAAFDFYHGARFESKGWRSTGSSAKGGKWRDDSYG